MLALFRLTVEAASEEKEKETKPETCEANPETLLLPLASLLPSAYLPGAVAKGMLQDVFGTPAPRHIDGGLVRIGE